ncbi:MAG: molybdopterin-binding protein [Eikenella sp.]|nr:molybdopterin-binding protein [Eikenella sp.]
MSFGLIIIGDEILHGSRADQHFAFFKQALEQRGLQLAWVQYLPDERPLLVRKLAQSFAEGLPVFVTGGIGGTPDDHTRQAAAEALGLPIERHAEAAALIEGVSLQRGDALDSEAHQIRLRMADFPQGSALVPNPYNRIAGFAIREHYFLPGFPVMAHPMAEWVLDTHYPQLQHQTERSQRGVRLYGLPESAITELMEQIERQHPGIRTFSLPTLAAEGERYCILFGLKAEGTAACAALPAVWADTLAALAALGAEIGAKQAA